MLSLIGLISFYSNTLHFKRSAKENKEQKNIKMICNFFLISLMSFFIVINIMLTIQVQITNIHKHIYKRDILKLRGTCISWKIWFMNFSICIKVLTKN